MSKIERKLPKADKDKRKAAKAAKAEPLEPAPFDDNADPAPSAGVVAYHIACSTFEDQRNRLEESRLFDLVENILDSESVKAMPAIPEDSESVKAGPAIPDDSDYERAIPDDSDFERVDSSEDEANVEVSSASVPATPSVPSVAELGRQEQRMIRLMENSDTDSNSEPLVLLDPSAPGYDQVR